jgi:hypothetical protein
MDAPGGILRAMIQALVPTERIEKAILLIRGQKVLLDRDLAVLYGVPTRVLVQAVKRNPGRFPPDFMFQLTGEELRNWRSQIVMSNSNARKGLRRCPYAFTEQGVAMLSSVLRSGRAVAVNIEIMRAFVRLRGLLASHAALERRLEALEGRCDGQDARIEAVFSAMEELMTPPEPEAKPRIGFRDPAASVAEDAGSEALTVSQGATPDRARPGPLARTSPSPT